jgi:DNA polymerase-4
VSGTDPRSGFTHRPPGEAPESAGQSSGESLGKSAGESRGESPGAAGLRTILHLDLDAFFASVEQRDDPSLRGRPVLVGGSGPRGVVSAASYEARRFGCRSAMPTASARRLCPEAVVVKPRFEAYSAASEAVFDLMERTTPLIEPLSIDEAFLDVTGSRRLLGDGPTIAQHLRDRINRATGLTASVGVASNKFLAKLASDFSKPDGLAVVDDAWLREVLPGLSIGRLWGVGPVLEKALRRRGLHTFRDVAEAEPAVLGPLVGGDAARLQRLARGVDERPVVVDRAAKSIGQERTFAEDLVEVEEVKAILLREVEAIARRLRRAGLRARTLSLKIRFGDYRTISRSTTWDSPADRTDLLWQRAEQLFDQWAAASFQPVRLIGASVSQLASGPLQPGLFTHEDEARRQALDAVADRIAERFGRAAASRGGGWRRE